MKKTSLFRIFTFLFVWNRREQGRLPLSVNPELIRAANNWFVDKLQQGTCKFDNGNGVAVARLLMAETDTVTKEKIAHFQTLMHNYLIDAAQKWDKISFRIDYDGPKSQLQKICSAVELTGSQLPCETEVIVDFENGTLATRGYHQQALQVFPET